MKTIKKFFINSLFILLTACVTNNSTEPNYLNNQHEVIFPTYLNKPPALPINNSSIENRPLAYCQHVTLADVEADRQNNRWAIIYGEPILEAVEQITPVSINSHVFDFGCEEYPPYTYKFSQDLPGFENTYSGGGWLIGLEWSPNGQYLLYNFERTRNYVAEFDTQGQLISTNLLIDPPQYTFFEHAKFPTWHPSGKEVAFVSTYMVEGNYFQDTDSIILIDFAKEFDKLNIRYFPETTRPLPYYKPISEQPVWSHDGSKLAYPLYFTSNGIGVLDITTQMVNRYDENHTEIIAKSTANDPYQRSLLANKKIAWLPGDEVIFFTTRSKEEYQSVLWAMELSKGEPFVLYQGNIREFSLSPSGELLALLVEDGLDVKKSTLITLSLGDIVQEKVVITLDNWVEEDSSQLFMRDLNWSDDGRYLAFSARTTSDFDLFAWDVQTGNITQLTDTPDFDEIAPYWRPTQK